MTLKREIWAKETPLKLQKILEKTESKQSLFVLESSVVFLGVKHQALQQAGSIHLGKGLTSIVLSLVLSCIILS